VERALDWDVLGEVERHRGRFDAALEAHSKAAELLAGTLPESHPLRLRNLLERELSNTLKGEPGADARLRQAASRYIEGLPAASAWRAPVQGLLADPRAGIHAVL